MAPFGGGCLVILRDWSQLWLDIPLLALLGITRERADRKKTIVWPPTVRENNARVSSLRLAWFAWPLKSFLALPVVYVRIGSIDPRKEFTAAKNRTRQENLQNRNRHQKLLSWSTTLRISLGKCYYCRENSPSFSHIMTFSFEFEAKLRWQLLLSLFSISDLGSNFLAKDPRDPNETNLWPCLDLFCPDIAGRGLGASAIEQFPSPVVLLLQGQRKHFKGGSFWPEQFYEQSIHSVQRKWEVIIPSFYQRFRNFMRSLTLFPFWKLLGRFARNYTGGPWTGISQWMCACVYKMCPRDGERDGYLW